jgi:hypothetical protein
MAARAVRVSAAWRAIARNRAVELTLVEAHSTSRGARLQAQERARPVRSFTGWAALVARAALACHATVHRAKVSYVPPVSIFRVARCRALARVYLAQLLSVLAVRSAQKALALGGTVTLYEQRYVPGVSTSANAWRDLALVLVRAHARRVKLLTGRAAHTVVKKPAHRATAR